MSITSLTSYFNTASFGDTNTYTRNQEELSLTLDSTAHQLADWKGLVAMSSGGMGFELGSLAARTLFAATPALCAIPFLTNAFTFFVGALSDTGLTRVVNYFLENGGEESESFLEQVTSQGGVRAMGFLGAGQSFVVLQLLMGLSSVSQGMLCGRDARHDLLAGAPTSFIHHLLQGLRCHFGSGMFTGFTGGVVSAAEQRIKLKTNHIKVGGQHAPEAHQPLAGGSPLLAGPAGIHLRIAEVSTEHAGGGGAASASNIFKPVTIQLNKKPMVTKELAFEEFERVVQEAEKKSEFKIPRRRRVYHGLGYPSKTDDMDIIKKELSSLLRDFAAQAKGHPSAYPRLLAIRNALDLDKVELEEPLVISSPASDTSLQAAEAVLVPPAFESIGISMIMREGEPLTISELLQFARRSKAYEQISDRCRSIRGLVYPRKNFGPKGAVAVVQGWIEEFRRQATQTQDVQAHMTLDGIESLVDTGLEVRPYTPPEVALGKAQEPVPSRFSAAIIRRPPPRKVSDDLGERVKAAALELVRALGLDIKAAIVVSRISQNTRIMLRRLPDVKDVDRLSRLVAYPHFQRLIPKPWISGGGKCFGKGTSEFIRWRSHIKFALALFGQEKFEKEYLGSSIPGPEPSEFLLLAWRAINPRSMDETVRAAHWEEASQECLRSYAQGFLRARGLIQEAASAARLQDIDFKTFQRHQFLYLARFTHPDQFGAEEAQALVKDYQAMSTAGSAPLENIRGRSVDEDALLD